MRANLGIIGTIFGVLLVLVALNAASYTEIESAADTEVAPNRSSLNAGDTGTRAYYELLAESGYEIARRREPLTRLAGEGGRVKPATLVIVGGMRRDISTEESGALVQWVAEGGRVVIVDRELPQVFIDSTAGREIKAERGARSTASDDAGRNSEGAVAGVRPLAPILPTALTRGVESVLPSRFAARFAAGESLIREEDTPPPPVVFGSEGEAAPGVESDGGESGVPEESAAPADEDETIAAVLSPAPVAHFADERGALLLDYAYGRGRVVLLGDPFVIANNGISRADNAVLALNLAGDRGALVAFDEYHHGALAPQNEILAYFRSTPALALLLQGCLLVCVIVYSRGRRFARAVPLARGGRDSKLEFVASLAELLRRARAYDLAIENLYARTRPALARYAGTNADAPRGEIARLVATRGAEVSAEEVETLMRSCEDVINGAPVSPRAALELAVSLRKLEGRLNLRRRNPHAGQIETTNNRRAA